MPLHLEVELVGHPREPGREEELEPIARRDPAELPPLRGRRRRQRHEAAATVGLLGPHVEAAALLLDQLGRGFGDDDAHVTIEPEGGVGSPLWRAPSPITTAPDASSREEDAGAGAGRDHREMNAVAAARVSAPSIPGHVENALLEVDVPAYAIDKHGIVRWLNPAAQRLVGDVRGHQFTSVVVPEQSLEAREMFQRNVLGAHGVKDARVEVLSPDGRRVKIEICSSPLRDEDDHRVVGMFGLATRQHEPTPPRERPHLTPRQHQVLHLLARGHSTEQIANELHLAVETVRNHVRRLLRALDAHSRLEAIAIAHRDGLLAI
jgi:PAS domain S-box-containing protein